MSPPSRRPCQKRKKRPSSSCWLVPLLLATTYPRVTQAWWCGGSAVGGGGRAHVNPPPCRDQGQPYPHARPRVLQARWRQRQRLQQLTLALTNDGSGRHSVSPPELDGLEHGYEASRSAGGAMPAWAKSKGTPLADALLTEALRISPAQLHQLWEEGLSAVEELEVRLRRGGGAAERAEAAVWRVVTALRQEVDIGGESLRSMVLEHPWLLLRDEELVLANVREIKKSGLSVLQVRELVRRQPYLLTMKESSVNRIGILVRELGLVNASDVSTILSRHPLLLQQGFDKNLGPLIAYFRDELGLPVARLRRMIIMQPSLLTLSATGALRAKVSYFMEEIGLDVSQVAKIVSQHPSVLCLSLEEKIKPTVEWLVGPMRRTSSAEDHTWGLGLNMDDLRKVLVRQGDIVGKSVTRKLRPTAQFLIDDVGLMPYEVAHAVTRQPQLLLLSIAHHQGILSFLVTEVGVDPGRVRCMFRTQPSILTLSTDMNVRPKVALFREELGAGEQEVARLIGACPRVLSASVQRRILPRLAELREMGLQPDFSCARMICTYSDERFHKWSARALDEKMSGTPVGLPQGPVGSTVTCDSIVYISSPHRAHSPYESGRRASQRMVRDIADGLHVLVLRCGTGGFAFAAAQGGAASVTAVDSRRWASAAAVANADLNELGHCVSVETEDLLIFLEVSRQTLPERLWDLVVVDFPRTAPQSRRNHATLVANAARAVLPGGMLFIASHGRAWKSSDHLASHVESAVARGELGGRASLLRTCDDDVHSVDGPVRGVLCSVSRADSPPPARLPEASEPTSPRTASAVALGLATAAALERKA